MKLLVTGGAGFIGSNFVRYMLGRHKGARVVTLDALTYAGNLDNLDRLDLRKHKFVRGDIGDRRAVNKLFKKEKFDAVVNFAAESHVDRSIHLGVEPFIRTNILGVQVLMESCLDAGVGRFLQVSTDEVYGSLGSRGKFSEATPIQPNNPYAATKASADLLVRAAHRSHGLNAVITRCSNNFGPYQFPEKLIPLMIANAMEDKVLPVYGDGLHVRDWIFVTDHCAGIDLVLRKAEAGSVYNIGGDYDVPNIHIVKTLLKLLGKDGSLIRYVKDRPGHDRRYAMDCRKIRRELGWRPAYEFEEALRLTVRWYRENRQWWERIRSGAYRNYYRGLYGRRMATATRGRQKVSRG